MSNGTHGMPYAQETLYLATVYERIKAYTIDIAITGCLTAFISIAFFDGSLLQIAFSSPSYPQELFLITLVEALYYVLLTAIFGRTLGKRWMNLRVISMDGRPVSYLQSLVRHGPYILIGIIGVILLKLHPPAQALSFETATTEIDAALQKMPELLEALNNTAGIEHALLQQDSYMHQLLLDEMRKHIMPVVSAVWFSASFIAMLGSRNRRTLHDHMANTVVISSY